MNTKKLDLIILLTLTVAVPVCTNLPYLGIIPDVALFFILPVGIIFCLIGVVVGNSYNTYQCSIIFGAIAEHLLQNLNMENGMYLVS